MKFDEIVVTTPGKSNDLPLEVTLFEGVTPMRPVAFSVPYAHKVASQSEKPGMTIVGYVHKKTPQDLYISQSKLEQWATGHMGLLGIDRGAIHSIRQLRPTE